MNRRTQKWLVNITLGIWIILGSMFATWLYFNAVEKADAAEVCRGWHGHRVACQEKSE